MIEHNTKEILCKYCYMYTVAFNESTRVILYHNVCVLVLFWYEIFILVLVLVVFQKCIGNIGIISIVPKVYK